MRQFSENSKQEILKLPLRKTRAKRAFLSAICRGLGTLGFSNRQKQFVLRVDNPELKNTVSALCDEIFKTSPLSHTKEKAVVFVGDSVDILLKELCIFEKDISGDYLYLPYIHQSFKDSDEVILATLKGLFIALGTVTLASGYHLEFAFNNGFLAADCIKLLAHFGIVAKTLKRSNKDVVYLKGIEPIGDTLGLLGASNAVLKLYDTFAEREASRLINRRLNCDLANIDKTIGLSSMQMEAIEALNKSGQLAAQNDKLKAAAMLRLDNPESSLSDLAAMGGISKSGMRHRLDKLVALYVNSLNVN